LYRLKQQTPVVMGPCVRRDDARVVRFHIVAPSTHGTNSAPPKSRLSLLVSYGPGSLLIEGTLRRLAPNQRNSGSL